jgi:serine/threonine protein kinase
LKNWRLFDTQIIQAVNEQNVDIAVECYKKAVNLPQTKTENDFFAEGISLNGKFINIDSLQVCFLSFMPYILKTLTEREQGRGETFLKSMGSYEYWQHHITEFDIVSKFMFMPIYAATLVPIRRFSVKESSILMNQIGSALVFLHSRGYCFMDVKPSNICLTGKGSLVLIDLGSIAQIGTFTESTAVYLPVDLQNEPINRIPVRSNRYESLPLYDWWMLLVTLLEKSMSVEIGGALETPSRSDIVARFAAAASSRIIILESDVLEELRRVIPTEKPLFQGSVINMTTEEVVPGNEFLYVVRSAYNISFTDVCMYVCVLSFT